MVNFFLSDLNKIYWINDGIKLDSSQTKVNNPFGIFLKWENKKS